MASVVIEEPDKMTTIKLRSSVRIRLASHARKDQTYEDLITQLLDKIDKVSA